MSMILCRRKIKEPLNTGWMTLHQKHVDPKPKFPGTIGKEGHHILANWDTCNIFIFYLNTRLKTRTIHFLSIEILKRTRHEHKNLISFKHKTVNSKISQQQQIPFSSPHFMEPVLIIHAHDPILTLLSTIILSTISGFANIANVHPSLYLTS